MTATITSPPTDTPSSAASTAAQPAAPVQPTASGASAAHIEHVVPAVPPALVKLAESVVDEFGFVVYDIYRNGSTLSVLVAGPAKGSVAGESGTQPSAPAAPAGPDAETLARISRSLSAQLDQLEHLAESYTLEVSTPGLERKLRLPAHFAGAVGEPITVKLTHPRTIVAGQPETRRIDGTLTAAPTAAPTGTSTATPNDTQADSISVALNGTRPSGDHSTGHSTGHSTITLPLADIKSARTVFTWDRSGAKSPQPAKSKNPNKPHQKKRASQNQ